MLEPALAATMRRRPYSSSGRSYFCRDRDSKPGKFVFNRTVGLRDTWAKVSAGGKR